MRTRSTGRQSAVSLAAVAAAALISLATAASTDASNQTFIFSGTQGPFSTTITNPYDGATAVVSGTYNVNNTTYAGQGTGNTLLMTNSSDFITLDSAGENHLPNVQTVSVVQRIVTGNGDDIMDMASADFTMPGISIFGGSGNELIWANAGDDTITPGNGNDTLDAGPGNDLINTGTGHDLIEGGTGTDTAGFFSPMSSYVITRTGPQSFTIVGLDNTTVATLSDVEFARFDSASANPTTLDLSTIPTPEPSALCLLGAAAFARMGMRRKN